MQPTPLDTLTDYLPDSVKELLTVISADAVMVLIKTYGGTRVQIPGSAYPEHTLVQQIGQHNTEKLCARYGGTTLSIARCQSALTVIRDSQILKDARSGQSLAQIAIKNKMTEAGVSKALRRIEKQEYKPWIKQTQGWSQEDLFSDH